MKFRELTLEDRNLFNEYVDSAEGPSIISSVQNFNALYMWRKALGIEICEENNVLYIKRTKPPVFGFLPPLCKNKKDMAKSLEKLKKYCEEIDFHFEMIDVEEWFVKTLEELKDSLNFCYRVYEDRDNSEYIYDGEKLRTLSGKKMHSKKNHYNNFMKNYSYEEKDIENTKTEVLEMAQKWLIGRESAYTMGELNGINDLLSNFKELNLKGTSLFIDGNCEAFTISEELKDGNVLVHVEKANDSINGLFTVINTLNMRRNHPKAEKVNREQDLGLEGLRKAKESWKPIGFVDKYLIKFYEKEACLENNFKEELVIGDTEGNFGNKIPVPDEVIG